MVSIDMKPSVRMLQSRPCLLLTGVVLLCLLYAVYGSQTAGQSGQSVQVILQPDGDRPVGGRKIQQVLQPKDTPAGRHNINEVKRKKDDPTSRFSADYVDTVLNRNRAPPKVPKAQVGSQKRTQSTIDLATSETEQPAFASSRDPKGNEKEATATNDSLGYYKEPENIPSDKVYALKAIDAVHISKDKKRKLKSILDEGNSDSKIMLQELADTTGFPRLQNLSRHYKQRFPDAIIIGCKKCGTGFMRDIFRVHSKIAMNYYEAHFFDRTYIDTKLKEYRKKMLYSFPDQITAVKTPRYWITYDVPIRIYRMNPNVKLVLLVRDPACRVVSDFAHNHRSSTVNRSLSFQDAFTNPKYKSIANSIRYPSIYDIHMQNWLNVFPLKQFMIIKNEDLRTVKAGQVYRDLEEFLGVDHELDVEESAEEVCVKPRYSHKPICSRMDDAETCKYDAEYPDILKTLRDYLRPHVANFEKLVHREFHWFK